MIEGPINRNLEPGVKEILWIEPHSGYSTGFNDTVCVETLGPEYLAGSVSEIAHSTLLDLRTRKGQAWGVEGALRDVKPDMVALKCGYTTDVPVAKDIAEQIHDIDPNLPIVIGGHHISLSPQDLQIPEVDAIVFGEGDEVFPQLVAEIGRQRRLDRVPNIYYPDGDEWKFTGRKDRKITNLILHNDASMNERSMAMRELCDPYRDDYSFLYYRRPYSVETARGCRYRCSFCSVWQFHGGTYKVEGWERTLEEIEGIPNGSYVNIIDDLAIQVMPKEDYRQSEPWKLANALIQNGNRRRFWMQCRADNIVRNKELYTRWAEAGLDMILVGLESELPEELKRVNKGSRVGVNEQAIEFLHSIGVKLWGAQIVFADATHQRFDQIKEYNLTHGIESPQFTIHTPLPGTVDWQTYYDQLISLDRRYFDFLHPVLPTALPIEQFVERYIDLYKHCHMSRDELNRLVALGRVTQEDARAFTRKFLHLLRPQNFDDTIQLHDAFWAGRLERTSKTIQMPDYIGADDQRLLAA